MTIHNGPRFGMLALSILAGVSVAHANGSRYTINPSTFVPGKTYTVTMQDTNCGSDDLSKATILATGSGITITPPNPPPNPPHKCDWTGTFTISQDAETGDFNVVVQAGTASFLTPIKIVAKAAGPIPPGLQPTVDVAWGVLPRKVSSDNFGARVTKLYYPIQVVIGNNSGYDLQLASVQFKLPDTAALNENIPTDSYYMVRASLQREQLIGLRNTTVNVIKAIGPILTGSTVFFDGSTAAALNHKTFFQGFTNVFSNPFEKGIELVFPDLTVQQLINLDNHTLRDGIIIANNTQVRTIVFVNRDFLIRSSATVAAHEIAIADETAAAEILAADKALATEYTAADDTLTSDLGTAENTFAQKTAAAARLTDPDRAAAEKLNAAYERGSARTAAYDRAATRKKDAERRAAAAKTAAEVKKAVAKRDALRNAGARAEEKALGGGRALGKHDYDQQEVMRQLGSLQLIGRSIAYLNRVSVISNPPGAGPQFTLSPASVTQGASGNDTIALTLTGSGLSGGTLTASDNNLKILNPKAGDGGTSFTATLDASKAAPGTYTLTLTTPGGTQSAQFSVAPAAITIAATQTPAISVKAGDPPARFIVTGTFLKNVTGVAADPTCTGTSINTLDQDPAYSDTQLPINVSATSAAAASTSCKATVTGKAGSPGTFTYAVTK